MKPSLTLIPTLIVNPSNIVVFKQVCWDPLRPSKQSNSCVIDFSAPGNDSFLNSSRKAAGHVSDQAKRKMSKSIEYLVTTASEKKVYERLSGKTVTFKIAFVTLTLPSKQIHSDKEIIHTCLASFIDEIKKYYSVKNYVWRAEKQKNGNIHFHMILDKFIPWSEMRDRWNRIINKLGYVDRYRDFLKSWHSAGFQVRKDLLRNWPLESQQFAYQKGKTNDYNNPNSTDIHSTKKIINIRKYLTKYLTKNEYEDICLVRKAARVPELLSAEDLFKLDKLSDTIKSKYLSMPQAEVDLLNQTGRIWGCNHELSNIKGYKTHIDWEISEEMNQLFISKKVHVYSSTYFSVYYIDYHALAANGASHLFQYFSDYLFQTFGFSEQLNIQT